MLIYNNFKRRRYAYDLGFDGFIQTSIVPIKIPAQINGSAKLISQTLQTINASMLIDKEMIQAILYDFFISYVG